MHSRWICHRISKTIVILNHSHYVPRVWKPIFEDYAHSRAVVLSGCCAPKLRMPVGHLRTLLALLASGEDEVDFHDGVCCQAGSAEPTQQRVRMLRVASAPRLSRRVIDIVSTKADQDNDGWIHYEVRLPTRYILTCVI